MNYNDLYILLILPALIISIWAQAMVKIRFAKYDKVKCKRGFTAAQAAQYLLKVNGITDVKIARIRGHLTDNYNPQTKVLSLSESTFDSTSIAAIGVAAHETGHAIQHATEYKPLILRKALVPAANIGSRLGPVLVIFGIILGAAVDYSVFGSLTELIIQIGIGLFSLAVGFYLITLPVEFNASNRALKILSQANVMDKKEINGTRKVLSAAAMTYVASALSAIVSLLRLLAIANNRKRR